MNTLVGGLIPALRKWAGVLTSWGPKEYTRTLLYEVKLNDWGDASMSKGQHNKILQKAVMLYLSHSGTLKACDNAAFRLMALGQEKRSGYSWRPTYGANSEQARRAVHY